MNVVENSPQNARNCTIFTNFLGGAYPQTPLAEARSFAARGMYNQNPKNFKIGPPPLRNPAYAPASGPADLPKSRVLIASENKLLGIILSLQ